ncbi:MAG: HyaD/HybD family hydrogenase maturation endopeptidase [Gammaproteobacteria bacterium]
MSTTLILGIGNNLLTDEGVGIHAIQYLSEHHPDHAGVTYLDGGTLSFTLAGPIADHNNLIVIDAARFGEPAGSIKTLIGEEMDRYLTGNRESVHEVGLMDLFDIARLSDTYPEKRALIGIQPDSLDWGEHPSDACAPSIKLAAEAALRLHDSWL